MEFDEFVLAAATGDLGEELAAREHADVVEFRMDLGEAPLDQLDAYDGELPIVATNRPTWEGGEAGDADGPGEAAAADRLETLERAAEHPAVEAVDVELASVEAGAQDTLDHAHGHGAATVVSVHDFEGTPEGDELARLLARAAAAGDVGKLAVTAEDAGDVLRLLSVTHAMAAEGARVATTAMGVAGRHSRAVAPLYGSRIGYAPVDPDAATAPGQYDLATLADLVARLRGDGP
jgi:3-dehydroquinate dehydratase-1